MNKFAFGTYRTSFSDQEHINALTFALKSGVRLIDTSTNYMNTQAETMIGDVLKDLYTGDRPDNLVIVSKVGYIQGELLAEVKENRTYEEVVEYDESCYHCINKDFISDQLTRSLERLQMDKLDVYLLHNPEYYLLKNITKEEEQTKHQEIMLERISEAFIALENEVKNGRINSYGISSNAFAFKEEDLHFLPYSYLMGIAQEAANAVGVKEHHFTHVQFPLNLLEQEGLKCATWAKVNGLTTMANRPLNASKDGLMFRLASYNEPSDYFMVLNEVLDLLERSELTPLFNMLQELDNYKHRFGWVGEFQSYLGSKIIPFIQSALDKLDPKYDRDNIVQLISEFINVYEKQVSFECAKQTVNMLKQENITVNESIQESALKFLNECKDIDYILIGAKKVPYVENVNSILNTAK